MQTTKIIIAVVALATIALVIIGIAAAQITATPNPTTGITSNNGFWGWMGRCLGFREATYNGTAVPQGTFQGCWGRTLP